jgi:hypothetical protein
MAHSYPKNQDVRLPLPSRSTISKIESFSDPSILYEVDLHIMQCSCEDWKKRRSDQIIGSFDRACKHLRQVLADSPDIKNTFWEPLLLDKYAPQNIWIDKSVPVLITYARGKEWMNPYAEDNTKKHKYDKFGFSLIEERWSYGNEPLKSDLIIETISKNFPLGFEFQEADKEESPSLVLPILDSTQKAELKELYELCNSIVEDDVVDDDEIRLLGKYCHDHSQLLYLAPFYSIAHLLGSVVEDGKITKDERKLMLNFLRAIGKTID